MGMGRSCRTDRLIASRAMQELQRWLRVDAAGAVDLADWKRLRRRSRVTARDV